ncbi:hypothetical protein HDV01_004048 [Terramyces sp. JEL0728]|nr:hypothetical protein HDV01_004048 [Terramyces sp. JEL0728]
MGVVVLSLTFAMSLELLDFPPALKILDAHSLWHCATIPVVKMYWDFMLEDALFEIRQGKGKMPLE